MREATARAESPRERVATPAIDTEGRSVEIPGIAVEKEWNPQHFAQEQTRLLVRQLFFSGGPLPVRQVVFSAVDLRTDVERLCTHVGETLAQETLSDIAVVGGNGAGAQRKGLKAADPEVEPEPLENICLDQSRCNGPRNLWFLPERAGRGWGSKMSMKTYLDDIRREFPYSIVQGPPVTECGDALSLAEFADGMVLVLSAQHTRRVAALRTRETLAEAQVRLLGTVLSDREFPIPEKIYRRL